MSITDEFDAYCHEQGIHLTSPQAQAAAVILIAIDRHGEPGLFSAGRSAGKTFLLQTLEEFFKDRPVPRTQRP